MRTRLACLAWVLACVIASACGDVPEPEPTLPPPSAPTRTAVQDRAIRALVMDVAEARACEALRGAFVPLPEDRPARPADEPAVIEGRLRISECEVERREDALEIAIAGQGWRWIQESAPGPLGTRYAVRGYVRFEARVGARASADLRYDEQGRRALLALTPEREVSARVAPIGAVPIAAEGGWSSVLGGLGAILGAPLPDRARPLFEERGAAMVQRMLGGGATLVLDLCTGQLDGALGALEDGAAPPARPYGNEEPWRDNARVHLGPNGLDASGPWATGGRRVRVDLEVEDGGPAHARLACRADAERIVDEYLARGRARFDDGASATPGRPIALSLEAGACDEAVLLVRASERDARYRYRVLREGDAPVAWVRCGPR
ncbi:MAG TPA: hypothetical protein VIL20_29040 [Sandaracinaceae bacterium]